MANSLKRAGAILKTAGGEFAVDGGSRMAAALTLFTIFSLVPLLFLVVAVAGFVFDDPSLVEDVVDRVTEVAGEDVGDSIESLIDRVRAQRGGTLSIGLVLAAFSASGVFQQAQTVLGIVFHVPEDRRRTGAVGWLVKRGIGLVSAVGLAVLAFTPIVAVGAVEWMVYLLPDGLGWLHPVLRLGVPLLSVLALMAVTGLSFQVLTSIRLPWKSALRGGAVTALIGTAAAFGVGQYLQRLGASSALGALGGIAILLLFFTVLWNVYLFGAEVTKVYGDYLEHGDVVKPSERGLTVAAPEPEAVAGPPPPRRGGAAAAAGGFAAGLVAAAAIWWRLRRKAVRSRTS